MKLNYWFILIFFSSMLILSCSEDDLSAIDHLKQTDITDSALALRDHENSDKVLKGHENPCRNFTEVNLNSIPFAVAAYVFTNYPGEEIEEVYRFDDDGIISFGVALDDVNLGLLFDESGAFLSKSALSETDIMLIDIPAGISDYIATNFLNTSIESAERYQGFGELTLEVELNNDTELFFDEEGNFLCEYLDDDTADDNDDDNDNEQPLDLPVMIQDFVNTNYSQYNVDDVDDKTLCGNTLTIRAKLEHISNDDDKVHLYFNMAGTFLFERVKLKKSDLPVLIQNSIAANYPGYALDGKPKKYILNDGSLQYLVSLENKNTDREVEVTFDSEGIVLCEEVDEDNDNDDDKEEDRRNDEDDDNDESFGLPVMIQTFVTTNYSQYNVDDVDDKTLCGNTLTIRAKLEHISNDDDKVHLYFNMAGTFLFERVKLKKSDLPVLIQNSIAANYPGYALDGKPKKYILNDGSLQYLVSLENKSTDREVVVTFDSEGIVLCEEMD